MRQKIYNLFYIIYTMRLILKWIRVIEALYLSLYNSKRHNRKKKDYVNTQQVSRVVSVLRISELVLQPLD